MVINICSSTEWSVLTKHFVLLCKTLPYNYQSTTGKLRNMAQTTKDEGKQLTKLITSSTDVRKINEMIITYLVIKSCYNGNTTSLVGLCDIMDELIDPAATPTCVQQIRYGIYMCMYVHSFYAGQLVFVCTYLNIHIK